MDIRTGPAAAATIEGWSSWTPRECLNEVSRAFQYGDQTHTSQVAPLVSVGSATAHWNAMPQQYKHAEDRNFGAIPRGAVVQCTGGQGHIFISLGGGMGRSTDYPSAGRIGTDTIENILKHFSGNPYAGWGAWINGRAIQGLVVPPPSAGGKLYTATQQDGIPGTIFWELMQTWARRGGYTGPIDGDLGVNSWKGVMTNLRAFGYQGPIDGKPGIETWKALQRVAATHGYTGPIDGKPGAYTYRGLAGFLNAM